MRSSRRRWRIPQSPRAHATCDPPWSFEVREREEGLGPRRSEQERRAPERPRDQRERDVARGPPRWPSQTWPREDEETHDQRRDPARERRDESELRPAVVELLEAHDEDGEAVGGENVVMEYRRAGGVHVRRHDQAGAREGRPGRREREDGYREQAAHRDKRIRRALAPSRRLISQRIPCKDRRRQSAQGLRGIRAHL